MFGVLRIFFTAQGTNSYFVVLCLLVASFAEIVGVGSLLPIISQLSNQAVTDQSQIGELIAKSMAFLGLENNIKNLLIIVVMGLCLKAIITFIAMVYVGFTVAKVATGVRKQLVNQLMQAKWGFYIQQPVGYIANSISVDATRAGSAYMKAASFLAILLQTIAYIVIGFFVNWQVALLCLLVGGCMLFALNGFIKKAKKAGRKQTDKTATLVQYIADVLANIKPLKAMGRQKSFAILLRKNIASLRNALKKQVIATQSRACIEDIIVALVLGLGMYFAIITLEMPPAEIVVLCIVFFRLVTSITKMQKKLQEAVVVESAYWRIRELLNKSASNRESNSGNIIPSIGDGCSLCKVNFAHQVVPILKDISINISRGDITVLQGASGAGKTTITDLLLGLYQPDSGDIIIGNDNIGKVDLNQWRRLIGYVPQEITLLHDTIAANITLGEECSEVEIIEALELSGAKKFIDKLDDGINTVVGERGVRLSGGERQRISIARSLVSNPKLLILDEVTSSLDPDTEAEICTNIRRLAGKYTILAITHRPAWVDIADRLYKIADGTAEQVYPELNVKKIG